MDQGLLLAKVLNTKPLQDVWKKAEMAEIAAVASEKVQGTLAWWQKAKHKKTKLDGITLLFWWVQQIIYALFCQYTTYFVVVVVRK